MELANSALFLVQFELFLMGCLGELLLKIRDAFAVDYCLNYKLNCMPCAAYLVLAIKVLA